ncbi:MAG: hypothetical protein V3W18_04635 [candidate division Zixibacteria bacterium]
MSLNKIEIINKLLETGTIDKTTLSKAISACKEKKPITLKILADYSGMTVSKIRLFFEEYFDLPIIDLDDIVPNPDLAKLVPMEISKIHCMIPAFKIVGKTHLAISNPFDEEGLKKINKYIGDNFGVFLAPEDQVIKALDNLYRRSQFVSVYDKTILHFT